MSTEEMPESVLPDAMVPPEEQHTASNGCSATPGSDDGCSGTMYSDNSLVWVRLGQSWWPGTVVALERCPQDFLRDLKKKPLAVVKFFEENGFVDIHKSEHIYPYNCERKKEFIKKGLNFRNIQNKKELFKKFESDVLMAQKLTGGELDVFTQIEEDSNKRRIDYSHLGFGAPKAKKKKDEIPRKIGSDISQAVRYKKESQNNCSMREMKLEHKIVIMEQPHVENMKEDLNRSCNSYTCPKCGFTCARLGVIIWHHKGHLNTVMNYDTGIRIPGRRRRRPKASKPKAKVKNKKATIESVPVDHSKTNGHSAEVATNSMETNQLLMDWDDEEEEDQTSQAAGEKKETCNETLGSPATATPASNPVEDRQTVADHNNRRSMRGVEAMNSAFDALLADTPNSGTVATSFRDDTSSYINNQSDSDGSDWEKYYGKESDDDDGYDDGDDDNGLKESDIKSLCEGSDREDLNGTVTAAVPNGVLHDEDVVSNDQYNNLQTPDMIDQENTKVSTSCSPEQSYQTEEDETEDQQDDAGVDQEDDAEAEEDQEDDAGDDDEEEDDAEESQDDDTRRSDSSSPSNSGPAFMLVAVDAHGNNVPMPALTDRDHRTNLVAVEASMEDGTSRTLYIDPAYLEPNVDLSNLMLHIDNSGQETVIIPSTPSTDTASHVSRPLDGSSSSIGAQASSSIGGQAHSISSSTGQPTNDDRSVSVQIHDSSVDGLTKGTSEGQIHSSRVDEQIHGSSSDVQGSSNNIGEQIYIDGPMNGTSSGETRDMSGLDGQTNDSNVKGQEGTCDGQRKDMTDAESQDSIIVSSARLGPMQLLPDEVLLTASGIEGMQDAGATEWQHQQQQQQQQRR